MKKLIDREPQERRLAIDTTFMSCGFDYTEGLEDEVYKHLRDMGLDELIPIAHEVQRIRSELEPLNKKLKELGYYHELYLRPSVDER